MSFIFYGIFILNGMVYIYGFLKMANEGEFQKFFTLIKQSSKQLEAKTSERLDKFDSPSQKQGYTIGVLLSALLVMGVSLLPLLIPILVGLSKGFLTALTYYLAIEVLFSSLVIIINNTKSSKGLINVNRTVSSVIYFLFKLQLFLMILFGLDFQIQNAMTEIGYSAFIFRNTAIIIFPIMISTLIVSSLYLYWIGLINHSKENTDDYTNEKQINWNFLLLSIVIISYLSLIYISEIDMASIVENNNIDSFYRTLDMIKFGLAVLIIPLMFKRISA